MRVQPASAAIFLEQAQDPTGDKWDVTVLKAGQSIGGDEYPEDVLKRDLHVFDNVPVNAIEVKPGFFEHLERVPQDVTFPAFPVGNTVGILSEPRWDELTKSVKATFSFLSDKFSHEIRDKALSASKTGKPNIFGLSIRAICEYIPALRDNVLHRKAIAFKSIGAWVDIVSRPAAGGGFERVLASRPSRRSLQMEGIFIEDLQTFEANFRSKLMDLSGITPLLVDPIVRLATAIAEEVFPNESPEDEAAEGETPTRTDQQEMPMKAMQSAGFLDEYVQMLSASLADFAKDHPELKTEQISEIAGLAKQEIQHKTANKSKAITLSMAVVPVDEIKAAIKNTMEDFFRRFMNTKEVKPPETRATTTDAVATTASATTATAVVPAVSMESFTALQTEVGAVKNENAELKKQLGISNTQRILMESLPEFKFTPTAVAELKKEFADKVLTKEEIAAQLKAKQEYLAAVVKESVNTVKVTDNLPALDEATKTANAERAKKAMLSLGATSEPKTQK